MISDELFFYMQSVDIDDDLPNMAWWCFLMDHVNHWNKTHQTNFDPHQSVMDYCMRKAEHSQKKLELLTDENAIHG